ncbi:MAG: redoxin domain-containing protein [Roseibacillus sp.]|nr:redoxin domain-containing protein [Roseibacillus sp.]
MNRWTLLFFLICVIPSYPARAGTSEGALRIRNAYEKALEEWAGKLAIAQPEEQLNVWENRPASSNHGALMWNEIRGSLDKEWAIDYCVWFLERAPVYAVGREEGSAVSRAGQIVEALRAVHYRSSRVGMLCLALTSQSDPAIMKVVEKVEGENPSEEVQGQASLAIAMMLKGLGDDPEVMEKRIAHLRSAIIKAHEVEVGDTSVSKLAMDEIFIIQNLTKGRTAPDAIGRDSSGEPFKLSMLKGKVTVVAFWHTRMREAERGLSLLRKLHEQHSQRGMNLIGVTSDSRAVLRGLRANNTIPWRNLNDEDGRIHSQFRVRDLPIVYVLDAERKIRYIGGPGSFVDLTVEGMLAK